MAALGDLKGINAKQIPTAIAPAALFGGSPTPN